MGRRKNPEPVRSDPVPARLSLEGGPTPEDPGNAEARLYLDRAGLDLMRRALDKLARGGAAQIHFLSATWSGGELSEERWCGDGLIAQHLRLLLRPDGEALREVGYTA